jgi:signal transduction histidine kinase
MSAMGIFKLGFAALILAAAGRFSYLEFEAIKERSATNDLCHAVSNYLETGAIRDAYENLQAGVVRLGHKDACVSVLSQGGNFSTNCVDPAATYNTTVCRAEANESVYAQVLYPRPDFMSLAVLQVWIAVFLSLMAFFLLSRWIAIGFTRQVTEELQRNIFREENSRKSVFRHIASILLERIGITEIVRRQTRKFQDELSAFEDRERRAAALQAKTEAEAEKSQAYIEMVKQIRHDIRSPISSLMAIRSELKADKEIEGALSYSISSIEKLIFRLGESAGGEVARLSIAEVLLEETVSSLALKFSKTKDVALTLNYDRERLSPVKVVPLDFQRVLENLLENAFDAARSGSAVTVNVSSDESTCRIAVEDNGCGIPKDLEATLFSEGATFRKVGGGGRGLSFVKSQIEAWSGKVTYSPLSPGSRFEITLPLMQTGAPYVGRLGPSKILVVDDDERIPLVLEASGFEIVDAAATFEEGERLFEAYGRSGVPVLVDEDLGPGLRGTDLIRRFGATKDTYLCTNDYDDPEVIRRAKALGVRILPKPLCRMAQAKPVPLLAVT